MAVVPRPTLVAVLLGVRSLGSAAAFAPGPARHVAWSTTTLRPSLSSCPMRAISSKSRSTIRGTGTRLWEQPTASSSASEPTTTAPKMNNAPRHDVGGTPTEQLPEQVRVALEAYQQHQQNAPKLDHATDVRTLIQYNHGFAVMSTFSKAYPEYPSGSVVGFTVDEIGRPLFVFSGMSTHTQDILTNPHCSLTVAAKDFKGAADGRVNLLGTCTLIKTKEEQDRAKELYLQKHPGAFWVDFGDFNWFRMEVEHCRFVGGFARAGTVTADQYRTAVPDPIAQFGPTIAAHMNDDHRDATISIVSSSVPGMDDPNNPIVDAFITSVDSLGMYIKVTRQDPAAFLPQQFKLRLPFSRQAQDRKDVKTLIVELTQQASASGKSASKGGGDSSSSP